MLWPVIDAECLIRCSEPQRLAAFRAFRPGRSVTSPKHEAAGARVRRCRCRFPSLAVDIITAETFLSAPVTVNPLDRPIG